MDAIDLFHDMPRVRVHAVYLGERIDIRPLSAGERLATTPLLIRAGRTGCAALFRYGVTVMFGLDPIEEASFLSHLAPLVRDPQPGSIHEETTLRITGEPSDSVVDDVIGLSQLTAQRLQVVASVLARSVALEYYEVAMTSSFERIEPLADSLKRHGQVRSGARALLRDIGDALLTEHRMVSRVEVHENPDLLWQHPQLEPLYHRLEQEYELKERRAALERKVELISRTVETVLDLLNHRRSLRVEWYIVILIVVEIFLTLYEMFLRPL